MASSKICVHESMQPLKCRCDAASRKNAHGFDCILQNYISYAKSRNVNGADIKYSHLQQFVDYGQGRKIILNNKSIYKKSDTCLQLPVTLNKFSNPLARMLDYYCANEYFNVCCDNVQTDFIIPDQTALFKKIAPKKKFFGN